VTFAPARSPGYFEPPVPASLTQHPQRLSPPRRSWMFAAIALSMLSLGSGCAPTQHTPPRLPVPSGPLEPQMVADEAFAASVGKLLVDGTPSQSRQELLAGVVRRQLVHAGQRFAAKQRVRGAASTFGALYLVRAGELRSEMLSGSDKTLDQALDVVAGGGDEGRSEALYHLRKLALPADSSAQKDVDEHLAALDRWTEDQGTQREGIGPCEARGALERRAVTRALLEPTTATQDAASKAIEAWVEAGLGFQRSLRGDPRAHPKREEAVEGFRAVSSGAATAAALYLRSGDAAGAADALSRGWTEEVAPPALVQRLRLAASRNDPGDWRALLEIFSRPDSRDEETAVDREVLRAATFGLAIEAYRRDPTSLDVSLQLASVLVAFGMPEAAPIVLSEAAKRHPEAAVISSLLEAVFRTIAREDASDDPDSARRVFAASGQILQVGDRPELKGQLSPSPAKVRALAANIEAHAGSLPTARTLIEQALADEKSAESLRLLAEIDRQSGDLPKALASLDRLLSSPELAKDPLQQADALRLRSDVLRESGDREQARASLVKSLSLLEAGAAGHADARVERTRARILDRFGDLAGAHAATEHAVTLARTEQALLSSILVDAAARALADNDLAGGRRVARQALAANLPDDDLAYIGLYVWLLERRTNAAPDGTSAEVLAAAAGGSVWTTKLLGWQAGRISATDLITSAHTAGQKTEARFYTAMAETEPGKTQEGLQEVAKSPALDLVEVQIARDVLAGESRKLGPAPGAAAALAR
jgi:cellulose synthase operon protein C